LRLLDKPDALGIELHSSCRKNVEEHGLQLVSMNYHSRHGIPSLKRNIDEDAAFRSPERRGDKW
jgi:hypothetical protein